MAFLSPKTTEHILHLVSENLVVTFMLVSFAFIALSNISKRKKHHENAKKLLAKAIATNSNEPPTLHPVINSALCSGCSACTKVCPEGDILQMIHHKAVLVSPAKCIGHGECEVVCPVNAITLVFGTKTRGMEIPRISSNYETNVPGLYIAGELGGMGLIRNAIKQGCLATKDALSKISKSSVKTDYDVLIVGAGPAGFASGLTAVALKKRYLIVEQNTVGGTIANYPRQKLVMTAPAELPLVGKMKFPKNKVVKEDLLDYFKEVQKQTGLKVQENSKFEGLEPKNGYFAVKIGNKTVTANKVILAVGVRGSPRKLGLPNEELEKVTYSLVDPEQYQGQHIAIVGAGNSAVEAAQSLANPKYRNKVVLLVRGQALSRCNEDNQKIITDMAAKNLVSILYESSVKSIESETIVLTSPAGDKRVKNDFLFVMAGAETPFKYLMSLGIKIDKKFGESMDKKKSA